MPTINVEMMQKLLQEFSEKEVLTGEEIKVIEQQIQELEARSGVCRDRLQNLNEDKDRLAAMMSRYIGGNGPSSLPPTTSSKPKTTAKIADHPTQGSQPANQPTGNAPGIVEELDAQTSESSQSEADNQNASSNDDAIKSINDALKGLFRK